MVTIRSAEGPGRRHRPLGPDARQPDRQRTSIDEEQVDPAIVVVVEEHPREPVVSTRSLSGLALLTRRKSMPVSRVAPVKRTGCLGGCAWLPGGGAVDDPASHRGRSAHVNVPVRSRRAKARRLTAPSSGQEHRPAAPFRTTLSRVPHPGRVPLSRTDRQAGCRRGDPSRRRPPEPSRTGR